MKWKTVQLGDVIDIFDSRRVPLNSRQRAQRQGPYPYYGASGVVDYIDDFIFEGRYLLVAEDGENLNSRKLPVAFFAKGRFWVNNHAHIIRAQPDKADDEFLKHWFAQANIQGYITGAAQPKLSQMNMKRIEIDLPPLPTQQRIAAILSAFDDLIENNTRRIAILEEMARRLYEEWFVHFRFPGHEEAEFDGDVPKGWDYAPLKIVARLRSGYAFKSKSFNEGGAHRLVTIKNVKDTGFDPYNVSRLDDVPGNVPAHCHLKSGDLLLSLTGNVGRVCVVFAGDFLLNQRVAKIEPTSAEYHAFSYFTFRDSDFRKRLENLATGVAQQNLSPVKTEELPVLLPPGELLKRYQAFSGPVMDRCRFLDETNANLRAQRDLLLPKLVSGEIDVTRAEAAE